MAKRGGFPGGMPGNMNNLMKQAQRMQRQMEETTKELENKEYTAASGGGAVSVTVSGKKEVVSVKLSPDVVDPDDIEMLEDLIVAATNEAFRQMEAESSEAMSKLTGGLGSLYGITSYLSDVLSYSRLLALGLATGVVAQVFNTLGSLAGGGIAGSILLIVVFAFGTVFNIAINALGAFVHSCRLQYVEFFGKFYTGGGRPFAPFERKTKYIKILKEGNDNVK